MSDKRELPFWCRFHQTFMQEILFLGSQEGLKLQDTEVLGGGTVFSLFFGGVGVRENRNRCMKNCVSVKPDKHFITDKRFARYNSLWALLCTNRDVIL